jgi:membrane protein DedA with SNARE-associated domain
MFHPDRLRQIESYYTRYGMLTLLIGRFIPFGVRNCLFMTAGMGRMSLWKFMVYDGIACLSSNTLLFTLAYFTGKNCLQFVAYLNIGIFAVFLVALIGFIWYKRRRTG